MLRLLWQSKSARRMDIAAHMSLTREEMESRRLEAAQDLLRGLSQAKVARRYGVSRTTTSRWHRNLVHTGLDSLKKRKATGRPSRLTADQMDRLAELYLGGAAARGFPNDRWTTKRLASVIEAEFGVHYDPDHVGRLMQRTIKPRGSALLNDRAAAAAMVPPGDGARDQSHA